MLASIMENENGRETLSLSCSGSNGCQTIFYSSSPRSQFLINIITTPFALTSSSMKHKCYFFSLCYLFFLPTMGKWIFIFHHRHRETMYNGNREGLCVFGLASTMTITTEKKREAEVRAQKWEKSKFMRESRTLYHSSSSFHSRHSQQ